MNRRWLPWITAVVFLGVAGSAAPVGAQQDPLGAALWRVTIDTPAVVESQDLVVSGQAFGPLDTHVEEVAVTVELLPPLPAACDKDHRAVIPVHERSYRVEFPLECNGPYRIQVAVRSGGRTVDPHTKDIGVAEQPPMPAAPQAAAGVVTWPRTTDLDAAGWVLEVDGHRQELPPETTQVTVPRDGFSHTYALAQMRWGVGGPGSDLLVSQSTEGISTAVPYEPLRPEIEEPQPVDPPPTDTTPLPTTGPPSPSTVPPTTAGDSQPTRGTGAPSTTLPEGYSEELPYGTPDDAFVPGDEPARSSAADVEESAAGTSPSRGYVHIGETRAPGLVAPFALGLMLITVAAHIAWYLRRSRPDTNGQGLPR